MIIPCTSDKSEPISLGDPWPCLRCGYELRGAPEPEIVRCHECSTVNLRSRRKSAARVLMSRVRKTVALGLTGGVGHLLWVLGLLAIRERTPGAAIPLVGAALIIVIASATDFRRCAKVHSRWFANYCVLSLVGLVASTAALASAGGVAYLMSFASIRRPDSIAGAIAEVIRAMVAMALLVPAVAWPFPLAAALGRRIVGQTWLLPFHRDTR